MSRYDEAFARLDAFVERQMAALGIPGMAIGLTDREGLLRVSTYGYADLAARAPVTPEHRFPIASVSKSFTAIAILQLHDEGLLDLHAPVTEYLPWFSVQSEYAPTTLHHLLNHTAGIVGGNDYDPPPFSVWALRETAASAPPGEHFRYSNTGYKTLGLVLEAVRERGYGEVIREQILDPLGMTSTDPVITNHSRPHETIGYRPLHDDRPYGIGAPLVPATWAEYDGADGCIVSTPRDMTAYLRMLLNRGMGPHGRILSEEGFRLLTQPLTELVGWPDGDRYGYGMATGTVDGRTRIGHGGGMGGHLTSLFADLDDGFGAVVFTNGHITFGQQFSAFALDLLGATRRGHELPAVPETTDPFRIPSAHEYAGRYSNGSRTLTFVAEGDRLYLEAGDGAARAPIEGKAWDVLLGWGPGAFLARHPEFHLFLLRFGRATPGDPASPVVEVSYGADWYAGERYAGPTTFEYPQHWDAYRGHYRSHLPDAWRSNLRLEIRKGALWLIDFAFNTETQLVEIGEGLFRVGDDPHGPERVRFDAIIAGHAQRLNYSCTDFFRTFTP